MPASKKPRSIRSKKTGKFVPKRKDDTEFHQMPLRIPRNLLEMIDRVKQPWDSRTAWILDAIYKKVRGDPDA